ncbi:MAG: molecular chaperone DnaJ [Thermodesulfobacteriota bacterium]
MSKKDYYQILGIAKTASTDEIKKAYRKLAFEYHPDRNPNDPEAEQKFKEASEAYEILSDPEKRSNYDHFGHAGVNGQNYQDFSSAQDIFDTFSDIFGDVFGFGGSRGRGPRPRPGADLRYNLTISFEEAVRGTDTELQIPKEEYCDTCQGSGVEPGHQPETCKHCSGRGQVFQTQGFFRIASPCPICRGSGKMITHPCKKCKGRGLIQEKKSLKVHIPAGVDSGSRLRLHGEGEHGLHGGPNGDLYVVINVEDHPVFQRQGQDLIVQVELSMVQAALGDRIEVPTLDEPIPMDIPRGTQSGQSFKLKGLGVPYLGSTNKGNLIVQVKVLTPTKLSKRQEELLQEFSQLEEEKPSRKVRDFFKRAMGDS